MVSDKEVTEVLEEIVKNPDNLFPTFSEEMAEKVREELRKAYKQKNDSLEQQILSDVHHL